VLSASEQAIAQAALAPGPHAVVSADREGIIRDWNETAEHIFGHSAGQAIGQTLDARKDCIIQIRRTALHNGLLLDV
jgi:PAS domain-containing protein